MIISETRVENHSCIILDPPVIPPEAPVIVTLHGLGTNSDDLVPFCEQLRIPECRFILPDAPLSLPGYPEGAYAWYDIQTHDRKEIEKSRDYLYKVIDRFSEDPNLRPTSGLKKKSKIVILMGFSQGGVMSLEAGLNYKGKIGAIVSMSGYIPDPWATLTKAEAPFDLPILLVHGTQDQVVPLEGSHHAMESLEKAGYHPLLKEFPMPHTISLESMEEVSRFLGKIISERQ